jgi:hypothetical protein
MFVPPVQIRGKPSSSRVRDAYFRLRRQLSATVSPLVDSANFSSANECARSCSQRERWQLGLVGTSFAAKANAAEIVARTRTIHRGLGLSMSNERDNASSIKAIMMGAGIGILVGAAMGFGFATLTGASAAGFGWFVVLHMALAMMLMGAWTAPCLLPECDAKPNEPRDDVQH